MVRASSSAAALAVELHQPSADADAFAAIEDAPQVDHRGRIGAHHHDGQLRRVAELGAEGGEVGGHALADLGRQRPALEQYR